jgi:ribose/xylose/arabinose/galactoside ABC-type transport system permease subunit
MAAAGMTAGWLVTQGVPLPLAFAVAILIGIVVGFANGTIISYARINPLIATLATLAIVRGLSYVISGGRELIISDPAFLTFGVGRLLGIPYIVLMLVATFLVFGWAMPRTLFGRYAYAIGSSAKAAQRAGVPVARWRIAYYVTCGALSALAGLVFVARTGNAQPSAALGIELDVITAVILGGTSLNGGRGRLSGTFIGLVLLGMVNNGLILVGVPAFWQQVVKGAILLTAVLYDELRRHRVEEA